MPVQDPGARIHNFDEVELGYDFELAFRESRRCDACGDSDCVLRCPLEIDIRAMIGHLREGDLEAAYQVIVRTNLFPSITGRLCPQDDQCATYGQTEEGTQPIGIGYLGRFLGDWAREHGVRPRLEVQSKNGRRIAIVGSGPAGLTAAGELLRLGYECTVFEAGPRPGGVLIDGISEVRLPRHVVEDAIDQLIELGVRIVCDTVVGRTVTLDELQENYDAIMVATGARLPYPLGIPGEDLAGVHTAADVLAPAGGGSPGHTAERPIHPGQRVAVIGEGDLAVDAARTCRRLDAAAVDVVCACDRAGMPARGDAIGQAMEEGIDFLFLHHLIAIHGDAAGRARELELVRLGPQEPGASFRRSYDVIIRAAGQGPDPLLTDVTPYLRTDALGRIVVDPLSLRVALEKGADHHPAREAGALAEEAGPPPGTDPVSIPIICAGGGVIGNQAGFSGSQAETGEAIITAMCHGKLAARTIHQSLCERFSEIAG